MNEFISKLKFKGKWRSYQQRVLDELEHHFDDNKLNIVAAPGAGKTTLGIEVLTRLQNPALILAPTITIKNQWKERINQFLPENTDTSKISSDIKNVSVITISTYQGLHTLYKNKDEKEKFLRDLKENNVKTLVLDEAHHLRTEWWATLNDLCGKLDDKNFKIVSLTGTPPYDVSPAEWSNYHNLCGPVDAEISIPELVKAKDLCPHQDLIYFSNLTQEEQKTVYDFEQNRSEFFKYINEKSDLFYGIESSVFINDLDKNTDIIYKNTGFTVSVISYLLSVDELNMNARILTEFLGLELEQIPKFDYETAQILFNGMLGQFSQYFKNIPVLKSKLKEYKLINGNSVDFTGKTDFKKLFARSKNKLDAIYKITKFEHNIMLENLREVILLDYIGKGDSEGLNILSVFNKVVPLKINLGILTGTLIVIPEIAKGELYNILDRKNIDKMKVLTSEFSENYLRVESYGNVDIVSVITELFEKGFIKVLTGTAALLGEGWDSPCVNTLIIASTVGSFMLSNQMRGRALRIDKTNPDKTSDIWHLVSLNFDYRNAPDFITIMKRFNTFEGISYGDNKIQNGIERLNLDFSDIEKLNCDKLNAQSFDYAKKRNNLKSQWNQVFLKSAITENNLAPQVYDVILGGETQETVLCKKLPAWCSGLTLLIDNCSTFNKHKQKNKIQNLFLKLCKKYGLILDNYEEIIDKNYHTYDRQNNLEELAKALLNTMCVISVIKTSYQKIHLHINKSFNSNFYITLCGCTNYERNIFIKAFEDIFDITDKNRYILKRGNKYLAVPDCIGTHGKNVKYFVRALEQSFGYFDTIYTRNPDGYKELLKAKYNQIKFDNIKNSRVWI